MNRAEIIKFNWLANLGAMIDSDAQIQVTCTERCREFHRFTREDLEALAEKLGRGYSLYNRRCPCRFTPGCRGWNRFDYLLGVYRPLRDEETGLRWAEGPRYSRGEAD